MRNMSVRYERPLLEIEYDQVCLVAEGCCRFVPIVLRLCGVPFRKQVYLEVIVERMRLVKDSMPQDDYTERPVSLRLLQPFQEYCEGRLEVLARAHARETGTVRITMSSQKGTILSHVILRFDSRESKPVVEDASGFTSLAFVPRIRSEDERADLRGRLPFPGRASRPPLASPLGTAGRDASTLWGKSLSTKEER